MDAIAKTFRYLDEEKSRHRKRKLKIAKGEKK